MKKWIIGVLVLLFAISIYVVAQPRNKQSAGDKVPLATEIQSVGKTFAEFNYFAAVAANSDAGIATPDQ